MQSYLMYLCLAAIVATATATNYCATRCGPYQKHIGCNHNQQFDAVECSSDAKLVTITDDLKKLLIDTHNEKRNFIAGGGDAKHKPACKMGTMEWDDELAELAVLNVKQCKPEHDNCHDTDNFRNSGQNIYHIQTTSAKTLNDTKQFLNSVNGWYNEVENSTQAYIDSYPEYLPNPAPIGHFTLMVADRNNRLGCAAATFTKPNNRARHHYIVSCNYAANNIPKSPIYAKCRKPTRSCSTGINLQYRNLCASAEEYNNGKLN